MTALQSSSFRARDMKLQACLEYAHHNWNLHRKPKTSALIPVANFFVGRCVRLRSLMMMPATVGDLTIRIQRALDLAHLEIAGKLSDDGLDDKQLDNISRRWQTLLEQEGEANKKKRLTPEWDSDVLKNLTSGLKPTEIMGNDVAASRALEASLMSYVTTSWTIIETMSGDLWEAAINAHPASLAHLQGKANRLRKSKDGASAAMSRESKAVPLDLIAMHGFDVRTKMGSILRGRFEFTRLESTREAYASAFEKNSAQIDKALSDISLDTLNAVRNLIVHKDGVADAEYLKKGKFLRSLPPAKIGDHISLDGAVVVQLVKPALTAANLLLIAVDDWLAKSQSSE